MLLQLLSPKILKQHHGHTNISTDWFRTEFGRLSGLEYVLYWMAALPLHSAVQEWTCRVILNIAAGNKQNQVMIAKHNGIDLIINALRNHITAVIPF